MLTHHCIAGCFTTHPSLHGRQPGFNYSWLQLMAMAQPGCIAPLTTSQFLFSPLLSHVHSAGSQVGVSGVLAGVGATVYCLGFVGYMALLVSRLAWHAPELGQVYHQGRARVWGQGREPRGRAATT